MKKHIRLLTLGLIVVMLLSITTASASTTVRGTTDVDTRVTGNRGDTVSVQA